MALNGHRQSLKDELEHNRTCIDLFLKQCQQHTDRHSCVLLTSTIRDREVSKLQNRIEGAKSLREHTETGADSRIMRFFFEEALLKALCRSAPPRSSIESHEFYDDLFELPSFLNILFVSFEK